MSEPLARSVYLQDTVRVARSLLGCRLVRRTDDSLLAGVIVETEAYLGEKDLGCHSAKGRTERTEVMFGPAGHAYVYLIYGMYHCLNAVSRSEGEPEAVLIRAIRPTEGLQHMEENRVTKRGRRITGPNLTNGPGKLCQALEIDLSLNSHDLCVEDGALTIEPGEEPTDSQIRSGPRIGIDYAGEWAARHLRFWLDGDGFVSR